MESSYSRREKARTRKTIIPTSTITTTPYTITNTTLYTPLPPSKERKSVFYQGLGPRPLFPDRHLIEPSNPNLSVLETLNLILVPSSPAENAQQRRYDVPCADSYHHKCSGLSRTVVRFREADNYQCQRSFRIGQNGLKCHSCNLPTHLRCTKLTRNERERAKTGALSWICCLRSTMSNDQETENDQNDDVDNNDRVLQECAKCKHPIRHKAPKATCNDCGAHYHLVCTGLLRTQREEIRDGRREWSCCSGREVTEVDHVLSLPATNPPATLVETNTSAAEPEKEPKAQLDSTWCMECKGKIHRGARQLECSQCKSPFHIQCMTTMRSQANVYLQTPTWRDHKEIRKTLTTTQNQSLTRPRPGSSSHRSVYYSGTQTVFIGKANFLKT